jgi:adenylate kinase
MTSTIKGVMRFMARIPKVLIELAVDIVLIVISTVKDILEKKKERKHGTNAQRSTWLV